MLAIILLSTIIGGAGAPSPAARPVAAVASRPNAGIAAGARRLSTAILYSLTPAQIGSLHPGDTLMLRPEQASESQRRLIEQLALAIGAGAEPPSLAVRLVTTPGGSPALALSAAGTGAADFLATRPLAIACHW